MKILHITYYRSVNPGTFLQAFGIQTGLKRIFPNASIDILNAEFRKRIPKPQEQTLKKIHWLLNGAFSIYRTLKFKKIVKRYFVQTDELIDVFNYSNEYITNLTKQYDLIVIGSDTVLEKIAYDNSKIGLMWGIPKADIPQIIFAASGDDCTDNYVKTEYYKELKSRLSVFKFIGVRDNILKEFLSLQVGLESDLVKKQPDPTYLLSLEDFRIKKSSYISKLAKVSKKIIFYHVDRRFKYRNFFAKKLKKQGYYLITPEYDPNCHRSFIALNHFEWGALFSYCDYVITDRFHDTVFALRHVKPVINIDWNPSKISVNGKSKRSEILEEYNIPEYRFIIKNEQDITNIIDKLKILFENFNKNYIQEMNKKLISRSYELLFEIKNVMVQNKRKKLN